MPVDAPLALADLDGALCSDGAPSARNLLVTVFGDVLAPLGPGTAASVQALASVLTDFGVNERLVRTSLTRLVNDDLLAVRTTRRRSSYCVAPRAVDLFAAADARIYRGRPEPWDGHWTLVVLDGAESTADRRATLRGELVGLGFGVVAPNVLASPMVSATAAAETVRRAGGFEQVLVMRSTVVPGGGLADPVALARRCVALEEVEQRYDSLVRRFGAFDDATLATLDGGRATKLRLLVVSTFRRVVLADPLLPVELLPEHWAGARARAEAARLYGSVRAASDRHLTEVLGREISTAETRFAAS